MQGAETEFAPAKINLALHVTGRRPDGYHELDSLVVFAVVGDRVEVRAASALSLEVAGPYGAALSAGSDNLVMKAAALLGQGKGAAIRLEKNLPVASGIGGGSADAAATLRALSRLWGVPVPGVAEVARLGADVPVCLSGVPARMQGIGETVTAVQMPADLPLVLVNPGVAVSTPEVFRALDRRENPPMPDLPRFRTVRQVAEFVAACRNDLEPAARSIAPVIGEVVAALAATDGCLFARMSGSGATCFGLYRDRASRDAAAQALRRSGRGWWIGV